MPVPPLPPRPPDERPRRLPGAKARRARAKHLARLRQAHRDARRRRTVLRREGERDSTNMDDDSSKRFYHFSSDWTFGTYLMLALEKAQNSTKQLAGGLVRKVFVAYRE